MSPLLLAALGAVILAGAFTMRSTGMGFSLVAAPFLVLVLGPFEGILSPTAAALHRRCST